jgi:hypothetical protein
MKAQTQLAGCEAGRITLTTYYLVSPWAADGWGLEGMHRVDALDQ